MPPLSSGRRLALSLCLPTLLALACGPPEAETSQEIRFQELSPVPLRPDGLLPMKWPDQFMALNDGFLWVEDSKLVDFQLTAEGGATVRADLTHLTRGMDRLVATEHAADGLITLVDSSGRVTVHDRPSGERRELDTDPANNLVGDVTYADGRVYLMLQGLDGGPAVKIHDVDRPSWNLSLGNQGQSAALQQTLGGGGITSCPDGHVYTSRTDDPSIRRVNPESGELETPFAASPDFREPSKRQIKKARRKADETGSVRPLIEVGRRSSRVSFLGCTSEGLLVRQVLRPSGQGAYVEVWDPTDGRIVGRHDTGGNLVLGLRGDIFYLGRVEEEGFFLDRIRYTLDPQLQQESNRA